MTNRPPSVGELVRLACRWEATAPKAGNVYPGRSFADLTVADFYRSADAIAPIFDAACDRPVGQTVRLAIEATRRVVSSNTNLGMVLLLAPLARVPHDMPLHAGIEAVLAGLTVADARDVFAAIRHAAAGGLGQVQDQDIGAEPTLPLRAVMALAQDRDLIARQYVDGFRAVFEVGIPGLVDGLQRTGDLADAIVFAHLRLLAEYPDSLIARKRGNDEAENARARAQHVLALGWPDSPGRTAFQHFDDWLRAEGNMRNPGTSADLVTASLFAALREGIMNVDHDLLDRGGLRSAACGE